MFALVRDKVMKLKCVSHIVLIQQIFLILLCIKVSGLEIVFVANVLQLLSHFAHYLLAKIYPLSSSPALGLGK